MPETLARALWRRTVERVAEKTPCPPEAAPEAEAAAGERPLVSFFVTAYRQEHLVRAAIEGAFAQTWEPLEILLSDDASPDGTWRVMQEMAAAYRGPHKVMLNRNPRNLGITAHVDRIMELTSGAFVVQNAGDDVSVPERTETLVAAWLGSGRRLKAIHSARRRMDAAGGRHEVVADGRVLADMTPFEVIRDHGTLVGATLGWDRDIWETFGPLGPTPVFDDFPTAFRASLIGGIGYVDEPLLALPDGRHLGPAGGRGRPQLPARLPHQGPALAPLVLAQPTSRRSSGSPRPTPRPAAGSARPRSPRRTSRSASPRPPGGGCRCGCRRAPR